MKKFWKKEIPYTNPILFSFDKYKLIIGLYGISGAFKKTERK
jgi:hypothetical protein